MRLVVDHRTTYRFSAPQGRLIQLLRMTPENTYDQTVARWHIAVDCDARMRSHRDGFGNRATMLYVEGPIDAIEITVTGEVVTSHSDGVLHGTHEPLPPPVFRRTTPLTLADTAIANFADAVAGDTGDAIAALHRLNRAICERFRVRRGRPDPALTAAAAFAGEEATSRDLAHILIAAARHLGYPARYVTGYSDLTRGERPTPHGWADAHVAGLGWIGLDPTLGLSPQEHHIRVSIGLDAAGAAPVAGSRLGEGDEALEVAVSVHREG